MKYTLPLIFLLVLLANPGLSYAQTEVPPASEELPELILPEAGSEQLVIQESFAKGEVLEILGERQDDIGLNGTQPIFQTVKVRYLEGDRKGEEVEIDYGVLSEEQKLSVGQTVVIVDPNTGTNRSYIFDSYRLPKLYLLLGVFLALGIIFAGWRGLSSIFGLGVSVLVLALFVVPQIIAGHNPLLISFLGALVIGTVSIYLAHGFSRRTTVAVVSTLISIIIAIGLAVFSVWFLKLTGSGSEEAYYLQSAPITNINIKGLLLGGIIIGALGVLDDITTAQAAAVDEIWKANPKLTRRELFRRSMSVGREHITSLVNTLALAYVGASLPALLLFTVYQRPFWVVANTETIIEEVVRTLVGSIALMVAVPITTLLAAYVIPRGGSSEATGDLSHITHKH